MQRVQQHGGRKHRVGSAGKGSARERGVPVCRAGSWKLFGFCSWRAPSLQSDVGAASQNPLKMGLKFKPCDIVQNLTKEQKRQAFFVEPDILPELYFCDQTVLFWCENGSALLFVSLGRSIRGFVF